MSDYSIHVHVPGLEVAEGYDGFLRGAPEPALMLAVYVTDGKMARLVGRSLKVIETKKPFPKRYNPKLTPVVGNIKSPNEDLKWIIVAIAMEEDNGSDIRRVYASLERHQAISLWSDAGASDSYTLLELHAASSSWRQPTACEYFIDSKILGDDCEADKWVGCSAWVQGARSGITNERAHFRSKDGKNDWTAMVAINQSDYREF